MPDITQAQYNIVRIASNMFKTFAADRLIPEEQWVKDLRQYRGVYDPEILRNIPKDKSKVYPKETHTKIVGFVAKMMEMLFPATEKNFSVRRSPVPSISEEDIKQIIQEITTERNAAIQQAQQEAQVAQQDPQAVPQSPASIPEITSEDIEARVNKLADEKAANMEQEIEDQLIDAGGDGIDYPQLCKKVLRSGGIYGYGVLAGPNVRKQEIRTWQKNPDGTYSEVKEILPRFHYRHCRIWDIYPDLSARDWWSQSATFERHIMLRGEVRDLAERGDFLKENILKYLNDNKKGNYVLSSYESQLYSINNTSGKDTASGIANKYEVISGLMYVSGQELIDAGFKVGAEDPTADVLVEVWFIGNTLLKVDSAPFAKNPAEYYHAFIFDEDEDSGLTGTGLCSVLRDSQLRLCAIDRASQDNMAASAGPVYEVNKELLAPGQDTTSIHSFQVIYREGSGVEAAGVCVRAIATDAHIAELIELRREVLSTFDRESSLPAWLFGNGQQLGEAFRTSNNMSMMSGGANMVTKDIVRSFDIFTTSVIRSAVRWAMEFVDKPSIKGDFQVQARGNLSLVAKEVRGAALDQFWATITPEERAICKTRKVLLERIKARDLPLDIVENEEDSRRILDNMAQAQVQAAQIDQGLTQAKTQSFGASAQRTTVSAQIMSEQSQAKTAEILARVESTLASVKDKAARTQLEHVKTLLQGLQTQQGVSHGQQG